MDMGCFGMRPFAQVDMPGAGSIRYSTSTGGSVNSSIMDAEFAFKFRSGGDWSLTSMILAFLPKNIVHPLLPSENADAICWLLLHTMIVHFSALLIVHRVMFINISSIDEHVLHVNGRRD